MEDELQTQSAGDDNKEPIQIYVWEGGTCGNVNIVCGVDKMHLKIYSWMFLLNPFSNAPLLTTVYCPGGREGNEKTPPSLDSATQ